MFIKKVIQAETNDWIQNDWKKNADRKNYNYKELIIKTQYKWMNRKSDNDNKF